MTKEGGQVSALKVLLEEVERAKDLVLPNPNWIELKHKLYPTLKDPITTVIKQKAECWLMNM